MKKRIYYFNCFRCSVGNLKCFLVIVGICFFSLFVNYQSKSEEATSSFLRINVDARGTAMGGANGAITDSIYSVYWNPAGLSKVLLKEFGATYNRYFQDINYSFIGYATPTDSYGTLAGQIFFLGSGPITSTYENLDGSFAGTGDSFSVADLGLGFSQSKALGESFAYGVNIKLLSHKIKDRSAFALAGDVGVLYQPLIKELRFGFALQNFSTSYKFMNSKQREPWSIKLATGYDLSNIPLTLATDYNINAGQKDTLNLGAEFWILDLLALRMGAKIPSPSGFLSSLDFGLGFNLLDLYQFDYSFSPHSTLGTTQRFSLIVRF